MRFEPRVKSAQRDWSRMVRDGRPIRWFFVGWFLISSLGIPVSIAPAAARGGGPGPGQACRCSLTKRMSGTCCCAPGAAKPTRPSCCSTKLDRAKPVSPKSSTCCTTGTPATRAIATAAKQRPSSPQSPCMQACPCGVDPGIYVGNSPPRLVATMFVIASLDRHVVLSDLPMQRWDDISSPPSVPPPKVLG